MEFYRPAGLAQVAAFPASALPASVRYAATCDIPVPVAAVFERMYPFGDAKIEITYASDGVDVSLSFLSAIDLDLSLPLAFIARDRRGKSFLIGAAEPPFPEITKTDSSGSSSADRAAYSYQIEWPHPPASPICVI